MNLVLDSSRQILQDLWIVDIVCVFPKSFCDSSLEILLAVRHAALCWCYKRLGSFSCKDWPKFQVVFDHLPELVCHGLVPPIGNVKSRVHETNNKPDILT